MRLKGFILCLDQPHMCPLQKPQTWRGLNWAYGLSGGWCMWLDTRPPGSLMGSISPPWWSFRNRTLSPNGDNNESPSEFLLPQMMLDDPRLARIPSNLWAKDKYDLGCIKNVEPLVSPKSTYRPRQPQYRLHQEAIDGITPVFNTLLDAGVIVLCPNSPCCTPIFPVKKGDPLRRTPIVPDSHY